MLLEFRIRNFALVDDVTAPFREGFNVITGETGAGKSVVINALSLALGAKAQDGMVRTGAESARLDGVFRVDGDPRVAAILQDAGIEPEEDGILTLTRELSAGGGRSVARVNGKTVPASVLRGLGELLVDLHGQYAHQTLLRQTNHTPFLDALAPAGFEKQRAAASDAWRTLRDLRARRRRVEENRDRMMEELDKLNYRIREIENLVESEEDIARMREDALRLENVAGLADAVQRAYALLSRNGDEDSALNQAARALSALREVEGVEKQVDSAAEMCAEAEAMLEESSRTLGSLGHLLEADPETLRRIQDHLVDVDELLRKTRCEDVAALLAYCGDCRDKAATLEADLQNAESLDADIRRAEDEALERAATLTAARSKVAAKMAKGMEKELASLAMGGVKFEAAFFTPESGETVVRGDTRTVICESGAERIEFLIAANRGEAVRPLADIASGGELSRVMLALKTLLAEADPVPILIFDEIDAGIGGVTAATIARKMKALANGRQVVSITHLPQIASHADFHIGVRKESRGGRALTRIEAVEGDNRLLELARMMGRDGKSADESKALAARMLREAKAEKREKGGGAKT